MLGIYGSILTDSLKERLDVINRNEFDIVDQKN